MTTKTLKAPNGKTIKIEMVRDVQDEVSYADGYNIVIGREVVEYTKITLLDETGKTLDTAYEISKLNPKFDAKGIAGGAVAKVGRVYLRKEMYDLVAGLLAEVEAETPKSDEQIAIETRKAEKKAKYDAWYNSAEQIAARKFEREMNDPNSDL